VNVGFLLFVAESRWSAFRPYLVVYGRFLEVRLGSKFEVALAQSNVRYSPHRVHHSCVAALRF
jgi:hypothetical protein